MVHDEQGYVFRGSDIAKQFVNHFQGFLGTYDIVYPMI